MACRFLCFIKQFLKVLACIISCFFVCGAGCSDFSEKVGNGYYYHCTSSIDRFIAPKKWNDKTPIIPSKIIKYKKKGGYVAAKREIIQKGSSGSRVGSGTFDYWILNTTVPEVHGPMKKEEFERKLKELGLFDKL